MSSRESRAEVERLRADLNAAAYRAGQQQSRLGAAQAAIERVRALAGDQSLLRAAYFTTPAGSRLNCSDERAWRRVAELINGALDGGGLE